MKYYYCPECLLYSLFNYVVIVVAIKRGAHIRHNVIHRKQVQCHWALFRFHLKWSAHCMLVLLCSCIIMYIDVK